MSFEPGFARRLCLSALLVIATGLFAHQSFAQQDEPQSLGDVARQHRAERSSHRKVYTNEDLSTAENEAAEQPSIFDEDEQSSQPAPAAAHAKLGDNADAASKEDDAKREAELQKRTQEVNQRYTDKVTGIKDQISKAKEDLERLKRDQVESTNQYRSSNGTSPSVAEYQEQQRELQAQMENQRNLISSLDSQLEDAQEAARHAGVRTGD